MLPNIAPTLIVQATILFAIAVLAEAALSYLGLGTPRTTPSWGRMLFESKELYGEHLNLALWPGVFIAIAVMGFNLLGDGLRDALDPTPAAVARDRRFRRATVGRRSRSPGCRCTPGR